MRPQNCPVKNLQKDFWVAFWGVNLQISRYFLNIFKLIFSVFAGKRDSEKLA